MQDAPTLKYPGGISSPDCTMIMSVMGCHAPSRGPNALSTALSATGWSSTADTTGREPESMAAFATDLASKTAMVCEHMVGNW